MLKLRLEDLKPAEASFSLSEKPGKTYTLRKFSLAERIWINQRFGKDKVKEIFEIQSLPEMAEIAHHLLKEPGKAEFPDFMAFATCIVTVADQVALTKALLSTIGIDNELIKSLSKAMDAKDDNSPNAETPNL